MGRGELGKLPARSRGQVEVHDGRVGVRFAAFAGITDVRATDYRNPGNDEYCVGTIIDRLAAMQQDRTGGQHSAMRG